MGQAKIFGIGFHKTATSSLAVALRALGYDVTGPNGAQDPHIADNLDALTEELSARHDAFQDNPWPLVYKKMDLLHPGSKFILTLRDPDRWIRSVVTHFGATSTPMRELIYGVGYGAPAGNEAHYVARMEAHNEEVRRHFADRPGDLLEIDLTRGGGWAPICEFLDRPVPEIPFPHANSAETRAARQHWTRRLRGGLGRTWRGARARLRG